MTFGSLTETMFHTFQVIQPDIPIIVILRNLDDNQEKGILKALDTKMKLNQETHSEMFNDFV
jgi:hypothetical protein